MNRFCAVVTTCALAAALLTPLPSLADGPAHDGDMLTFRNASGVAATFSMTGGIDRSNPFFQKLGTNGRSCETCHQPSAGWSLTPENVRARFNRTRGRDPLFRLNDGANSPNADVSSFKARASAYSMLLTKGLIRVGMALPANAEFDLIDVDDPYGYASAAELSLFRRPLPSANLRFLSTVMWDGRETFADPLSKDCIFGTTSCFASLRFDLADQANGATLGHAQGAVELTQAQRDAIVDFEMGLFVAQIYDDDAKHLTSHGALGGPVPLAFQTTYFGINDVVSGDYRTAAPFDPRVFSIYDAWDKSTAMKEQDSRTVDARRAVLRGQSIFNTKPIRISGVKGLNDELGVAVLDGTCTTCHNTPGGGNHSVPAPLDIGISDAARSTPDLPLYVLRNRATGETITTSDPGRAMVTGKWKDIGRFKGPILRGLAARPPYFHNGLAANLAAVVDFYNDRFNIGFTAQEREDLIAFLRTL
ncbi:MAG TPA: cytochrome C [Burkholderiales bacterium]|nr:cytochrome C [Burkholderiales bacterium]